MTMPTARVTLTIDVDLDAYTLQYGEGYDDLAEAKAYAKDEILAVINDHADRLGRWFTVHNS